MFPKQKPKPSELATAQLILVAVILICFVMAVCALEYLAGNKEIVNPQPVISSVPDIAITPIPEINPNVSENMDEWKIYRNEEYGFEFKYPSTILQSSFSNNIISYFSAPIKCEGQSGKIIEVSDFKITFESKSASNYKHISELIGGNDGSKIIGGKIAYYIYAGAEMEMPVQRYIIEQSPTAALEISVYYLERGMVTNCILSSESATNELGGQYESGLRSLGNQILSTFKFTEPQK